MTRLKKAANAKGIKDSAYPKTISPERPARRRLLIMCEQCNIFKAFVSDAGLYSQSLCYPCYMWYLNKKKEMCGWLEFRRISGEEIAVEKWLSWYKEKNND